MSDASAGWDSGWQDEQPQAEELKRQFAGVAKLKGSYETQGAALGYDPNMLKSMGTRELMGFVDGLKMRAALGHAAALQQQEQASAESLRAATALHQQQLERGQQQDEQLRGFVGRLGEVMTPRSSGEMVPQAGDFGGEAPPVASAPTAPPLHEGLMQALRDFPGAASHPQFDNLLNSLAKQRERLGVGQVVETAVGQVVGMGEAPPHFIPAAKGPVGTVTPIKGDPKHMFLWQSGTTGSAVPVSTANDEVPQEVMIGDKSTGWYKFPDGKFRRKPGTKDNLDASQFDADGDGILNDAEFKNAMMAKSLGGIYPGMKVKKPGTAAAAAPAAGAASWEGYSDWKKKKNKAGGP